MFGVTTVYTETVPRAHFITSKSGIFGTDRGLLGGYEMASRYKLQPVVYADLFRHSVLVNPACLGYGMSVDRPTTVETCLVAVVFQ